ncbi:MAG TPA: shikimate dehydrogenase [Dysgonamonadaceae bacterium]|nr:shikimate dehydrogenase [Dysgonamonadaceae bacterium]
MDAYGLIGFPLKHSFSAAFFAEKFSREHIDAEYLNFEIDDILQLREVILFNQHLKGLNVTIPYKEKVIPFLDEISDIAATIGAVNVIKITREPGNMYFYRLAGYNTDYIGFKKSITPLLQPQIHRKALILGTGGASKAVSKALFDLGLEHRFVSRSAGENRFTYDELTPEIMKDFTVIVNASPVGTFPNVDECPQIPYSFITQQHLLYDLIYNPDETLFLKQGERQGATTKNGREMLELQALESWLIWNQQ